MTGLGASNKCPLKHKIDNLVKNIGGPARKKKRPLKQS